MRPARILTGFVLALFIALVGGCTPKQKPECGSCMGEYESQTEHAVQAAALEALSRYTSGDFAGAWLLYTDEGKAAISQADYVRLNKTCPHLQGMYVRIVTMDIRGTGTVPIVDGDSAAVGVWFGDPGVGAPVDWYTLRYEHGEWLLSPTDADLASYRAGVDATIAAQRAAGTC